MNRDNWKGKFQSLKSQVKSRLQNRGSSSRGRTSTPPSSSSGIHSNPDRNMGIGGINRDMNLPRR